MTIVRTRRQLLQKALATAAASQLLFGAAPESAATYHLIAGEDLLSRESAAGYLAVFEKHAFSPAPLNAAGMIVSTSIAGASPARFHALRSCVEKGASLILENGAYCDPPRGLLAGLFGIHLAKTPHTGSEMYLRYSWPIPALVRTFGRPTPLKCEPHEAIAHFEGKPIALKKNVGVGVVVFLGSMLGPHLRAEDREATELASLLLRLKS